MQKIEYSAIFHVAEEGGYWVEFYDLPVFTQGDDLEEAILMAADALLCLFSCEEDLSGFPPPTPLEKVKNPKGEIVRMIAPKYYKSGK